MAWSFREPVGGILWLFLTCVALASQAAPTNFSGPVKILAAGDLASQGANYFDLEGKTIRFTPNTNGFMVEVLPLAYDEDRGARLMYTAAEGQWFLPGWPVELPFTFPFSSRTWTRCYINNNGNVTFGQSESSSWSMRDPWPDGTMRSVAAALDLRAIMGQEAMIAPLWAPYDQGANEVYYKADSSRLVVTWKVRRPVPYNSYYTPLGTNLFQARLFSSGIIEFSYVAVPERDGIVGVFSGAPGRGAATLLDQVDDTGDAVPGNVDVRLARVEDVGTGLRFVLDMAQQPPTSVPNGSMGYRVFLNTGLAEGQFGATVGAFPYYWSSATEAPRVAGYSFNSNAVSLYVSKMALSATNVFSWAADVVWWGGPPGSFDQVAFGNPRIVTMQSFGKEYDDISKGVSVARSNVFEVFHYPVHRKLLQENLASIYTRMPPVDDLVVLLTDYRSDDLYSHGPGTGAINVPLEGIGPNFSSPMPGAAVRSLKVQAAAAPVFVGAPRFAERVSDGANFYHGHAFAVGWISHELLHRWGAQLSMRNGIDVFPLTDPYCGCHWTENLNLVAVNTVHPLYATNRYAEASPLGGRVWQENGDGTFTKLQEPYLVPTGLSALDLYILGLMPTNEVPETFLLKDPIDAGNGRYVAEKQTVGIANILSAMGPRQPAYPNSQTNFTLGVYLFHRSGEAPELAELERAVGISGAVSNYFFAATGGRMRISYGSPAAPKVSIGRSSNAAAAALEIEAEPGRTIAIESSPDLVNWTVVTNAVTFGLETSFSLNASVPHAAFFRASVK